MAIIDVSEELPEKVPERFIVSHIIVKKKIANNPQNHNSSYLQEVADYLILQDAAETATSISLNRQGKCPRGTVDDSILLNDAFDFIKLNYNCPDSEKVGSGKGSRSNGKTKTLKE